MAETGLEKAEKRYAQAKARLQGIRNREATKRRKVILGGALLDLAERDSTAAAMLDRLVRNLPRQQDRKAFTIGMRLALPPPLPQAQMRITRPDAISGLGLRAPVPKPCSG